jgi:hypothetical protein
VIETTLNEPIISAVKATLETDLPAQLTAIDTGLPTPVNVYDYLPPVVMITDYPTIGIGDGPTTIEDDIASSWTEQHTLLIVAHLQDPDPDALSWMLRRYTQAMLRVISADRTLDGTAFGSGGYRTEPGPMLADDPEKPQLFMSWTGFSFWAKVDAD